MNKHNIILIGMPSAGKSTIGVRLADELGKGFIDTDSIIRQSEKKDLKDIVNNDGLERFLEIQENNILKMNVENHIVATGGSVVYSDAAMKHLKKNGVVVYLKLEFEEIEKRLTPGRRFARNESQSIKDLYNERVPLYEKYADITVNCSARDVESVVAEIKDKFN